METSDSILNILREELVSLDRIYKKYIQMPKAYLESCLRTTHSSTFAKALSTVFTFLSQQWNGNSHNKATEAFDSFRPTSVLLQ